jgi:hypothetical protein
VLGAASFKNLAQAAPALVNDQTFATVLGGLPWLLSAGAMRISASTSIAPVLAIITAVTAHPLAEGGAAQWGPNAVDQAISDPSVANNVGAEAGALIARACGTIDNPCPASVRWGKKQAQWGCPGAASIPAREWFVVPSSVGREKRECRQPVVVTYNGRQVRGRVGAVCRNCVSLRLVSSEFSFFFSFILLSSPR